MYNKLTKALLGPVDLSDSECDRITPALLTDNFLYNTVMESLVAERGPEILSTLQHLQRQHLLQKIRYVAPTPQLRIVWDFVSEVATVSGRAAQLRARRFFGDREEPEAIKYWQPRNDQELASIREPWARSVPPPEVLSQYSSWLHRLDPDVVRSLKESALLDAEA